MIGNWQAAVAPRRLFHAPLFKDGLGIESNFFLLTLDPHNRFSQTRFLSFISIIFTMKFASSTILASALVLLAPAAVIAQDVSSAESSALSAVSSVLSNDGGSVTVIEG